MPHGLVTDPLVFVAIDPDGTVTLVAHRAEMGTGSRTSLPMVLADEMGADWARVKIVQAPGDEPRYGNQDTDGSRSMRHHIQSMRQMGAAVRTMLARAAAERWQVEPRRVAVERARGGLADRRAARLRRARRGGDGAAGAGRSRSSRFKDEAEFRYIGKGNVPITDLHDITTGKAVYGADVTLPGHEVRRDRAAAGRRRQGDLLRRHRGAGGPGRRAGGRAAGRAGADDVRAARRHRRGRDQHLGGAARARELLEIEWEAGPNGGYDSAAFRAEMEETAGAPGRSSATRATGTRRRPRRRAPSSAATPGAHGACDRWSRRRRWPR